MDIIERTVINFYYKNYLQKYFSRRRRIKRYNVFLGIKSSTILWVGCIVTVDIENSKVNIEFKYEPFIEE